MSVRQAEEKDVGGGGASAGGGGRGNGPGAGARCRYPVPRTKARLGGELEEEEAAGPEPRGAPPRRRLPWGRGLPARPAPPPP